jgi:NAD(P)-dependent dehydrogenase (short-subunit alcohol dehydrogenase family)
MKVLIFHGYLLRGTGSNVYNANLAQALARAGHEVHLLCQDLEAASLPWIDGVGRWRDGELAVEETGIERRGSGGSVTAYLPDIAGLLPVYVADVYEGFEARTYPELSDAELDRYIASNVAAVGDVSGWAGGVDAALSNHLVMGRAEVRREGPRQRALLHRHPQSPVSAACPRGDGGR